MFANRIALETLVRSDAKATADEKSAMLAVLAGNLPANAVESVVLSFGDAAKMLGYKSKSTVYNAVRSGLLTGVYPTKDQKRASGVTRESVRRLAAGGRT